MCGATGFAQSGPDWVRPAALPKPGEPVFFHKEFSVPAVEQRVEFAGACDGSAQVFINGTPAAELKGILRAVNAEVTGLLRRGRNVLEVRAVNATNTPVLLVKLSCAGDAKGRNTIVTDGSWMCSSTAATNAVTGEFVAVDWARVQVLGRAGVPPWGDPFDPTKSFDAYNSWRGSLGTKQATPVENISSPRGYKVELVRSAQDGEGSWISLAFDPQGRLTVAREKAGLLRMTITPGGGVAKVEVINENLLECRGLLYAHDALYVNANNSKALYRLRSTRGDDTFDEVKLLKSTEGGVGHGRNGLTLGPDGRIYFVHGNNVRLPADLAPTSPYKNFAEDRLLPCPWDSRLFDSDAKAPCGHIMRADAEGTRWEIVAGGFRNPYDIAFNAEGELFTFDADMEWDVGAPWYRPTRVHHVVSGGEYGWRHGTSMWPTEWPDDLPPLVNVGLSSPTGVKFGTASQFPPKYRRAFFISDWAYGRILAVHLKPKGASYSAAFETFLTGRPLNVTDLEFGPDGAMWFTTGGRGTQAGLYRVSYTGPEIREQAKIKAELKADEDAAKARALRQKLESFHGRRDSAAVDFAWLHLDSDDAWIRHAARVAIEHQDVALWQQHALNETRTQAALTALTALARCGGKEAQPALLASLDRLAW
ncbi:MAG: PQQ-dependent sugar dehydrogenase, partial [Verrucomicrobia bacterium]|nr:PQQ-dependent sugar dehydrogenase [Verrucomicrobiota bacterium]